jgi:hypothetical protein
LKIKKTLQKIEDQTFGICEVCGEEIDMERLKLRPVTGLCIDYKSHQEKLEKLNSFVNLTKAVSALAATQGGMPAAPQISFSPLSSL